MVNLSFAGLAHGSKKVLITGRRPAQRKKPQEHSYTSICYVIASIDWPAEQASTCGSTTDSLLQGSINFVKHFKTKPHLRNEFQKPIEVSGLFHSLCHQLG